MKKRFSDTGSKIFEAGLIKEGQIEELDTLKRLYNVKVPNEYASRIKIYDEFDPIWKTVIPSISELENQEHETKDPIGDKLNSPIKGIIHRYLDRVVLMPTNICAVYCRFCFRKDLVGKPGHSLNTTELNSAINYIQKNEKVWEVIISGGDPLVLTNRKISELLKRISRIDHVKVIRFHTRVPVVTPSRIDNGLIKVFKNIIKQRKAIYIITHINHSQEVDIKVEDACSKLIDSGIPLLNQMALLKGINDTPEIMEKLLRKLVEIRIKPYYLHHLDLAQGTNHFRTTISEGQNLVKALRGKISGLCQPTYVIDIPEGKGKVPIGPNYVKVNDEGQYLIEDPNGVEHLYLVK